MSIPIPDGSVVITPTEVYKEVRDTHQAVQQMVGKVDTFISTQSDHEDRLRKVDGLPDDFTELKKTVNEDHAPRIGKLETRIAMYSGAAGVLGTAAGYLASWAIYHH